uniref:Endonuclease/exonuclease/phosphatase domain-containing protein n=1 Tax=Neobodo designis TaxID=312471 RepID=A0A7S1Q825_NEODS|mmetsp:Transcript_36706/g.113149  ORF Transcript_36706/g.113149 Transcript_36706/m.113149 type:complete len:300 (+) Transcript_36706:43-942(+)|eukprot:CAMPEP_0174854902 /NCGR_PEP_ID=MMETSP1114-20130205/32008_1 /TAXON_ID=312471 /ORGANISM="Neobodo designis, Strain CCAP 1951/1" /LENGTH=299 /DNA_ID=CAMNT_0016089611 /DNA_START=39 /DNA_END=938 /DNA_ORIENTATION=-
MPTQEEELRYYAQRLKDRGVTYRDIAEGAGYKSNFPRAVNTYMIAAPWKVRDIPGRLEGLRRLAAQHHIDPPRDRTRRRATSPPATRPSRRLRVLYWNHGASDHMGISDPLRRTAQDKVDIVFGDRIKADSPHVVVIAELTSKTAWRHIASHYGYQLVKDSNMEVAIFVRNGLQFTPVLSGDRWITIDVRLGERTVRVTGVHLTHKCFSTYPQLTATSTSTVAPDDEWVVIGDFNRDPEAWPAWANKRIQREPRKPGRTPSLRDFVVSKRTMSAPSLRFTNHPELESKTRPHPAIAAIL